MNGEIFRTQVDSDGLRGTRLMVVREYRAQLSLEGHGDWGTKP